MRLIVTIDNELTLVDSDIYIYIYVSYGHCIVVMFIIQRALTRPHRDRR